MKTSICKTLLALAVSLSFCTPVSAENESQSQEWKKELEEEILETVQDLHVEETGITGDETEGHFIASKNTYNVRSSAEKSDQNSIEAKKNEAEYIEGYYTKELKEICDYVLRNGNSVDGIKTIRRVLADSATFFVQYEPDIKQITLSLLLQIGGGRYTTAILMYNAETLAAKEMYIGVEMEDGSEIEFMADIDVYKYKRETPLKFIEYNSGIEMDDETNELLVSTITLMLDSYESFVSSVNGSLMEDVGFSYYRVQTVPLNSSDYKTMYRLYNPNSGEHFYTGEKKEKDALAKIGWKYEGVGWYSPIISYIPVYRLYNAKGGEHHYTSDRKEMNALVNKHGWKYEGVGWCSEDHTFVIPAYREYNPNAFANNHNYTINLKEHNALINKYHWKDEGIAWFGVDINGEYGEGSVYKTTAYKSGRMTVRLPSDWTVEEYDADGRDLSLFINGYLDLRFFSRKKDTFPEIGLKKNASVYEYAQNFISRNEITGKIIRISDKQVIVEYGNESLDSTEHYFVKTIMTDKNNTINIAETVVFEEDREYTEDVIDAILFAVTVN